MQRFWKWAAILLAGLAAAAAIAVGYTYFASERIIARRYPLPPSQIHASTAPQVIARGAHLVWPYGCADCHKPSLQGTYVPALGVSSANLTGLGFLSDADFDHAIRRGLRPDGTSLDEGMPSDSFQYMADADLAAIISYIRSLAPAGATIPQPGYDLRARWQILQGTKKMVRGWFPQQTPALRLGSRYARGRELAMTACGGCHGTSLEGQDGSPAPPNLTLVASYPRADFMKLMHTGKAAGNRELPLMSSAARLRFSHFADAELNALYDYLVARGKKLTASAR